MVQDSRIAALLNWLSALSMIAALYLVFLYAPTEATMGDVQRIFYFHVSSAWVGFFAFFVTLIAGIAHLRSGSRDSDVVALSSVEIGITFTTMAVITGSIWAKATWNAWWPWQQEPRLVLITILLLLYLSYLMLRAFIEGEERKARFAAVYGIVAFASVPFTFMSVRWWQSLHPVIFEREGMNLSPAMLTTFLFCLVAFTLLYFTLLLHRTRLGMLADEAEGLKEELSFREGGSV
ncbi:MAG TPA: cytochrome c biogenesis protein [Anaerolineae bacterium]|nr:cytochrome c biogenesis protein [Anaerolineae bacterium]